MFKDLKVVFMGTPEFCVPTLKMLIEKTNVVLVVSQPDKEVGRKKELKKTASKVVAEQNGIEVFQPNRIKKDYEKIMQMKPDLIVTAAYGQIIPKELIDLPRLGCMNIHGSILPKYRGAAPIQWSIINGDEETGITLMYMDESMDTGNIIDIAKTKIEKEDNYHTLYEKLSIIGSKLLEDNLEKIVKEENASIKQDDNSATHARMLTREDELINFDESTKTVFNKIRGVYPSAYFMLNGNPFKVLEVDYIVKENNNLNKIKLLSKNELGIGTKDGYILLKKVKPFGKKEMDFKSFLNGVNLEVLESSEIN